MTKIQWTLIFALIFALLTAIFAVLNVNAVHVNYIFGEAEISLVLVIISSSLLGGLIVGLFGIIRQFRMQKKIQILEIQLKEHKGITSAAPATTATIISGEHAANKVAAPVHRPENVE